MSNPRKGGFNIGSVGGGVSVNAGGDVVAGDKVTSMTTITNGFNQEEDKQQFVRDIEELRTVLRELRGKIQEAPGVSQNQKDEIVAEVMQQITVLKKARGEAGGLPVGRQPSQDTSKRIEGYLDSTKTLLNKVNELSEKIAEMGTAIGPYVKTALPLLLSARHVFGIP